MSQARQSILDHVADRQRITNGVVKPTVADICDQLEVQRDRLVKLLNLNRDLVLQRDREEILHAYKLLQEASESLSLVQHREDIAAPFLRRERDPEEACEYGHLDCALVDGGRCSDEADS